VILGALFPGVNDNIAWRDPACGSQIEFASFAHLARAAEKGKFDFFFLTEDLRLPEQDGGIYDLAVIGRPHTLVILTALAAVTTHLGLAGTVQTTYNEPYQIARQFATLDHLSGGRAAWNVVTSPSPSIGENFRRGGYLDRSERYTRAAEFLQVTRKLWDSWAPDAIVADKNAGRFVRGAPPGAFEHHGGHFDTAGHFTVPRSPQGHPVIMQAGDSDAGRELAAASADMVFTRHGSYQAGRQFCADIRARAARHGRGPAELKIVPAFTFALGDSEAEAREHAREIRRRQVSPQVALRLLEQVWNCDLSGYDAEGPLPAADPVYADGPGAAMAEVGRRWRALAEQKRLSIRELIIEVTGPHSFVGTPATVAAAMTDHVRNGACDGFILVPHVVPGGLDEFVDRVVPVLQERGVLRADYQPGSTLRGNLGLPPLPSARR
jgi:FMN-dependent oxidoreductase (nitrilotriacetate monooxygenase family)